MGFEGRQFAIGGRGVYTIIRVAKFKCPRVLGDKKKVRTTKN